MKPTAEEQLRSLMKSDPIPLDEENIEKALAYAREVDAMVAKANVQLQAEPQSKEKTLDQLKKGFSALGGARKTNE